MKKIYYVLMVTFGLLAAPIASFWYLGIFADSGKGGGTLSLLLGACIAYLAFLPFSTYRVALRHMGKIKHSVGWSFLTLAHIAFVAWVFSPEVDLAAVVSSMYAAAMWLPVLAVWLARRYFAEITPQVRLVNSIT